MNDMLDLDDDFTDEEEMADDVIELTDVVEPDSMAADDESIIELTDVVQDTADGQEDVVPELAAEFDVHPEDELEEEPEIEPEEESEGEIDDLKIELPEEDQTAGIPAAAISMDASDALPAGTDISMDNIQVALERVIEKKFADKIESILFEVMEKVIEKEIAQIRESLQQDLDQISSS